MVWSNLSEETMVVLTKKPPPRVFKPASQKNLQASYDAIPKAHANKAARGGYSTKPEAMRKAVSRYMQKQKDAGLSVRKVTASHTKILENVCKVRKESGCEAAMAFVSKSVQIRIVFKGKGAKVVNANNTLALLRRHKNQMGITIEAPSGGFHVGMDDIEWHIWLGHRVPLFVIKKSGIPEAGLGVFAAQKFEEGDLVSMYCGVNQGQFKPEKLDYSDKAIQDGRGIIYNVSENDAFLGFHYANDPSASKPVAGVAAAAVAAPPEYNVKVLPNLLVEALLDIEVGDELFMEYNIFDNSED